MPHSLRIIFHQIQFVDVHGNISKFTGTDNTAVITCGGSHNINLRLLVCPRMPAPPLPDLINGKGKIVIVIKDVITTHLFKSESHIIRQPVSRRITPRVIKLERYLVQSPVSIPTAESLLYEESKIEISES